MRDLRRAPDALDRALIRRPADHAACIDRAAELKLAEGLPARIPERVEQVAGTARRTAAGAGIDPDLAATLWREKIEWAIAREETVLGSSSRSSTERT